MRCWPRRNGPTAPEIEATPSGVKADDFDGAVLHMFQHERLLQQRTGAPKPIAIVDDRPDEQYLYPEFLLAQRFWHGIDATIADGRQLHYEHGKLLTERRPVDVVYNRLVDFAFDHPEHQALRAAYLDGAVVVTPNPHVHALCADKRNFDLAGVSRTVLVTAGNEQELWEARKTLFFKPAGGHGSKAVYRGDKVTKRVWAEIVGGGYVAQEFAPPSERMIKLNGIVERRKTDVRLYTYDGQILLTAARLYQGQTTNFRTSGGGFAPVFVI